MLLTYREVLAEALDNRAVHAATGKDRFADRESEVARFRCISVDRTPIESATSLLLLVVQRAHRVAPDDDLRTGKDHALRGDVVGEGDASALQVGGEGKCTVRGTHVTD